MPFIARARVCVYVFDSKRNKRGKPTSLCCKVGVTTAL